jgi:chemotaxis family two-component system response regulator Rcp1
MTRYRPNPLRLLIADQQDAVQATRECLDKSKLPLHINTVHDAKMLFEYLKADTKNLPQLILLDLNLAGKNALEVLAEIKNDDIFRKIPVIIFSYSNAAKDIEKSYELGASCFVNKPRTTGEWCDKINKIGRFWTECSRVPQ